jgi:hypothetical protein
MKTISTANHANTRKLEQRRSAKLITSHLPARRAVVPRLRDEGVSREGGFLNLHRFLVRRSLGEGGLDRRSFSEGGFFNLRVLFGLFVMLVGVTLALVSFGPATTGFAQGTTREQIAVALAQALNVQIPACVPGQEMFHDVPASSPFCPFIEELVRRGITGGCGGGNYCPNSPVTRAQMAAFLVKVNGSESHTTTTGEANTITGIGALQSNTIGSFNTANGYQALFKNTTGSFNTATGVNALFANTEGESNSAFGLAALALNTIGIHNTANGYQALFNNTTGNFNTANGSGALFKNTEGNNNTATGDEALFNNTTGVENSGFGAGTLASNTTGSGNTAAGKGALKHNTEGGFNTAIGPDALGSNTTGDDNTAIGDGALFRNTTGGNNTANGAGALVNNTTGRDNTAIGDRSLHNNTTGNNNIALGVSAGNSITTANNVIAIGHPGANVDNSCYIGNIFGATTAPSGVSVVIDANGKLGTIASSKRFKEEIQPMDKASEALLSLKPVTFRYKNYKKSPLQFGLIAEEVAEVNPDLVARDKDGEIYTVRYDQINAMLLNEFLKEHKKVEEQQTNITQLKSKMAKQEAIIAQQQKGMEVLTAQLKEQAARIQKVSAQLELRRPAAQTVLNGK